MATVTSTTSSPKGFVNKSGFVNKEGFDRLAARFRKLKNPDCKPLMLSWILIVEEDNKRGILAGTDKDGYYLKPVTYRPKKVQELTPSQRLHQRKNARKGILAGFGVFSSGFNNNLSSTEYRKLDGPPLAPRRQFSRVITNFKLGYGYANGRWFLKGGWVDVVSPKGFAFLPHLFKKRNLAGVRPTGRLKAKEAAWAFMIDQIRSSKVKV